MSKSRCRKVEYYRYLTKNIHILFRLIDADLLIQRMDVLRVWKTNGEMNFREGRTETIQSMFDGWIREDNLRHVSKKVGKMYVERIYGSPTRAVYGRQLQ